MIIWQGRIWQRPSGCYLLNSVMMHFRVTQTHDGSRGAPSRAPKARVSRRRRRRGGGVWEGVSPPHRGVWRGAPEILFYISMLKWRILGVFWLYILSFTPLHEQNSKNIPKSNEYKRIRCDKNHRLVILISLSHTVLSHNHNDDQHLPSALLAAISDECTEPL